MNDKNMTCTIIRLYVPILSSNFKTLEESPKFYDQLSSIMNLFNREHVIIGGDFNAKTKLSKTMEMQKPIDIY